MILEKLTDLATRIEEMKYALKVFDSSMNYKRNRGKDIDGILVIKTTKKMSILGSRWFGIGSHDTEFELPFDMVEPLQELIKMKIKELESNYRDVLLELTVGK
jgi:hypothetical protein